jgi:hypothetical protein
MFSRNDIVVPVSGWVPNIEPGKKCQHGVYIPSTQDDQTYAEKCDNCRSLRAFINLHDMTLEEINQRQRIIWTHTDRQDVKEFLKAIPIRKKHAEEKVRP